MSRVNKWKLEKTKVKVVFRLQFHATHIPQTGWDKLFISFIPMDSGKATAKTTKANVRNGTCKWADPIYETARLLQDAKSKQFDEKLYKLLVAMGSSRASVLGEAVINLADYADALKPSVVALPLSGCNSGTTLHVTVQLLTSKTGFREFEQQRELRDRGLQTGDKHDGHSSGKAANLEEIPADQMEKVSARLRSTSDARELSLVEEETGNEEYADSSVGFEGSSNTSEGLYTENPSGANEIDSRKDEVPVDMNGDPNCPSVHIHKGDSSGSRIMAHGSSDSVHGWGSDYSLDNDLAIANVENNRLRGNLELAESSIFEIKLEVSSLQSQAEEIRLETQNFSCMLATEISSCEEMAKEVSLLKAECSQCKEEIGRLKSLKMSPQIISRECSHVELYHLLQDTKLRWVKGILVVEDRIRELQNKTYLGFHERDSKFLHSELEALLNALQDLKHGTEAATSSLNMLSPERTDVKDIRDMSLHKSEQFASGTGFDVEVCEPEIMLRHFSIPPLVSQEPDSISDMDAMKKNLFDLVRELDEAKVERESLVRKMGQMECYYEALIQELEENQKQMLGELQNLRNEHSACLYKISTNKVEMEAMRQNMNEQILQLAEERRDLDVLNKELERRAATSEAALRRARLNYSIAVDRLQKDLELLSSQVLSMFETNENLIKQAFAETSQTQVQGFENMVQNFEDFDGIKVLQSQNQNLVVRKQLGGDILLEDMKKSLCLQEELYQKVEEELSEMHYVNLHLDIFSKTLQETLREANSDFSLVISKINELVEQLRLSKESKDLLMERSQAAMDEVHNLREYNATCTAQYNDVALQNQILESNLETVSKENILLVEKLADCEAIMVEYRSYQSKYDACLDEKTELSGLLAQEVSVTSKLQNEISILNEELVMLKSKISLKENLEETISSVRENLGNLLASYEKHFSGLSLLSDLHSLDSNAKDCKDVIFQLEEIQHNACSKIHQLIDENKNLENERSAAVMSLSNIKSEFLAAKKKFKNDMHDIVAKANISNAIVENLQLKLESVANKLLHSSEVEEKHVEKYGELLADLSVFKVELPKLLSRDAQLVQEISDLNTLYGELERSKLSISELIQEKQNLLKSLHTKAVESANLASEFSCLKENLRILQDELDAEKGVKDQLESAVGELSSQLNIEQNKVHDFTSLLQELERCKLTISELIQEKQDIFQSLQDKTAESAKLVSEVGCLKENLMNLQEEFDAERCTKDKLESAVGDLTAQLNVQDSKLHDFASLSGELDTIKLRTSELIQEKQELLKCLEDKTAESSMLASEVGCLKENLISLRDELYGGRGIKDKLECAVGDLTSQLNFERNKLHDFAALSQELERSKMTISELRQEKQDLLKSLQDQTAESDKLASKVNFLKENLRSLENELHAERCTKDKLECTVGDLASQLNIEQNKLLDDTPQKAELAHFTQLVADLELEKNRLSELLLLRDKSVEKLQAETSSLDGLEGQLSEMHEYMITTDVKNVFFISLYETRIQELEQKLQSSDVCFGELQKKHHDMESLLNNSLANESHYAEQNAKLMQNIESLRCKLEVSLAQSRDLSEENSIIFVELSQCKKKLAILEARISEDKDHQVSVAEELKNNLAIAEEEIIDLVLSTEQLEITIIVLEAKLQEQHAYTTSLKKSEDELTTLRARCTELSDKLSQQMLRTEEFKNLSIHLKELKNKADVECLLAREKRESEGSPVAMQESLRIAFIKEQYETKIQELKQQLSISKKHGEEMLLKLQDTVDEIENRKRSEVLHSKRNEELALKLLALEDELQSVLSDNREKIKAYDRMKAELECAVLSLECCKEEKEKLETSLKGCEEEKSRAKAELSLAKKQLEDVVSTIACCNEESVDKDKVHHLTDNILYTEKVQDSSLVPMYKNEVSNATKEARIFQDNAASENVQGITNQGAIGWNFQQTSRDHSQYHCKTESLKSSIKQLEEELERMKNENSLIPDDQHFDSDCEILQNELICLEKANEELRSIFPSYNEVSSTGNALERVLALEIELAEALRAKHNSKIHFQSSFLKQHTDEEAVLKSFRDINELIKEMLELRGKYSAVEAELKEMHDRYSQLSLQFAEVEGDRQKLKMTLKNIRTSRKLLQLNRSSSATNTELSS